MNKRDANARSTEGKLSIGDLRGFIIQARARGGMSTVNPQLTLEQACNIYAGSLACRDDAEVPKGLHFDVYKQHDVPSRDSLIIRNILRDCA